MKNTSSTPQPNSCDISSIIFYDPARRAVPISDVNKRTRESISFHKHKFIKLNPERVDSLSIYAKDHHHHLVRRTGTSDEFLITRIQVSEWNRNFRRLFFFLSRKMLFHVPSCSTLISIAFPVRNLLPSSGLCEKDCLWLTDEGQSRRSRNFLN